MTTAVAERLPAYYPDSFPRTGTVDGVDFGNRVIIVNDFRYYLSDNMVTHTRDNEFDTVDKLQPGVTVGFRVTNAGTGQPLVTEAWILPADMGRSAE